MKHLLLTISIVFLGLPMLAQDIHFPPAIVAAGGSSEGGSVTLSRWRLSPIHVITLPDDKFKEKDMIRDVEWSVFIYPNPVEDFLYVKFRIVTSMNCILRITDILGREVLIQDHRTIQPQEVIELNLSDYMPAPYFLHIESSYLETRTSFTFQKL